MAQQSAAQRQMEGERRHLTVMFTDMVDFTGMGESLGEESVFELTRRIAGEQGAAIQAQGGVVQDFAGDGIMAVFGAPIAMEDAALRACRTALDIQDRIQGLQAELRGEPTACARCSASASIPAPPSSAGSAKASRCPTARLATR